MNWKVRLALLSLIVAIFSHGYLALHYYPLHLGVAEGEAICTLSAKFNCDAVSASRFASLFGIPMAIWGLAANFVFLLMLLVYSLSLTESRGRLLRLTTLLTGFSAVTSIAMGSISLFFLGTYCLFCIFAYLASFVTFECMRREQQEPFFAKIGEDILSLFTSARINLIYFLAIPGGAFFLHNFFIQHYGAGDLDQVVNSSFLEWQAGTAYDFSSPPLLSKGSPPEGARMTIVEFADFRCGHCKMAATPISAFAKAKADVLVKFFAFPLDASCNSSISQGDGLSCRLAKSVLCANRQEKGWELHDLIFAQQDKMSRKKSGDELDWELKSASESIGIRFDDLKSCIDSAETHDLIKAQASLGVSARVEGTPTIYVNGKKLPRGQLIPVLERVYQSLINP